MHPVAGRHLSQIERVDPLKTGEVVAIFRRIGSALVIGVDAADAAEVVFRGAGVELVAAKRRLPCRMRMPESGTEATMAPRCRQKEKSQRRGIHHAIRQGQLQHHGAAVAARLVFLLDGVLPMRVIMLPPCRSVRLRTG